LEATLQLLLFPVETLDELGVGGNPAALREALSRTDIDYRYELGLGTLVSHDSELILITHDHWGDLDTLGAVQFRNAAGDPLLEMDGAVFKDLIRYQDGGTMILGRSAGGDRSDYLSAMVAISRSEYSRSIIPAVFGSEEPIDQGNSLIIVRQGRNGSDGIELMEVSIESTGERWGQMVYQLRCAAGGDIMPGDSGGGLWLGGRLVGNMWKSKYTYGLDWDSLELEQEWTETSYAAGLPDFVDELSLNMGRVEIVDDAVSPAGGQEY
jgi:hypothetical protein